MLDKLSQIKLVKIYENKIFHNIIKFFHSPLNLIIAPFQNEFVLDVINDATHVICLAQSDSWVNSTGLQWPITISLIKHFRKGILFKVMTDAARAEIVWYF